MYWMEGPSTVVEFSLVIRCILGFKGRNWPPTKGISSAEEFSLNNTMMVGEGCAVLQGPKTSHLTVSSGGEPVVATVTVAFRERN